MYWEENKQSEKKHVTDDVGDLVFSIQCRCLPVDHAYALSQSVLNILPWLVDESVAGVHSIYVAASGNGWMRPEEPDALLHPSRRTRLELRVPNHRVKDARQLEGSVLNIDGYSIDIKTAIVRPMSSLTTLFSRYLMTDKSITDENHVLDWVAQQLNRLDIEPRKMLCGVEHDIKAPEGFIKTRSLMLADLDIEESLRLQKQGLGSHRHMGCGLFIPHRGIDNLRTEKD